MGECCFSVSVSHVMGPAASHPCCLPHDFLHSQQFLAVPTLLRDAFRLPPAVFCPAVRQPSTALGHRAAPRGIARSHAEWATHPGEEGRKMGIYHPLGSTAQGINISHPALMPAERPCLVCPEDKRLVMGDKSGGIVPILGLGRATAVLLLWILAWLCRVQCCPDSQLCFAKQGLCERFSDFIECI